MNRRLLPAYASLAFAIAVSGCTNAGSGGGPATPSVASSSEPSSSTGGEAAGTNEPAPITEPASATPSDEPTGGGLDPTPGGRNTVSGVCARVCARIQSLCPGAAGGPECASDCASSAAELAACINEYLTALDCIARAPFMCAGGDISSDACQPEVEAFATCVNTKIIPPGT